MAAEGSVLVLDDSFRQALADLLNEYSPSPFISSSATRYRLPAIYGSRNFAGDGGLIFYGANPVEQFRQAAHYIDRILRGEKPGNLPVQQPTNFELMIDLRAAKALGLTVPSNLLLTADKVIAD